MNDVDTSIRRMHELNDPYLNKAATQLQSQVRRYARKKSFRNKKKAAITLQSQARKEAARKAIKEHQTQRQRYAARVEKYSQMDVDELNNLYDEKRSISLQELDDKHQQQWLVEMAIIETMIRRKGGKLSMDCLLYTSDAADE